MKKRLLFIILFISTLTFSQNYDITQGNVFKDKKKHTFLESTLNDDNGGIVVIKGFYGGILLPKIKGYYIQHFDSNLNLKKGYTFEVKKNRLESAFIKNGKLHLIEFNYSRKNKSITYNILTSSLDSFEFSSQELLTFSTKESKKYFGVAIFPFVIGNGFNQMDSDHLGEIKISKNNNFFSIIFDVKEKNKETHKVFVYNHKFELVYEKLIVKNIKDKLFEYNTIEIDDDDGTLYFIGKAYENNTVKSKKNKKPNYHFELTSINKDIEKTVSFKKADKFINTLELAKSKNKITCLGFYGNKNIFDFNGVFLMNLNGKTLEIEDIKFSPFSEKFLIDKYGNKERKKKRKKEKGIENLKLKNIELLENGDFILSAEEQHVTSFTSTSFVNGQTSFHTRTVYHFDDIVSVKLDNKGNLLWSKNINKAQIGLKHSSFTSMTKDSTTYYFFNDLNGKKIIWNLKNLKFNLKSAIIDKNGEVKYKNLMNSKFYYKVKKSQVTKKGELILLGKDAKDKNSRIIKIKPIIGEINLNDKLNNKRNAIIAKKEALKTKRLAAIEAKKKAAKKRKEELLKKREAQKKLMLEKKEALRKKKEAQRKTI